MKKYISIAIGMMLAMGIATTASAGPTCRNGMCTDGGGERPELLCYRGSQQITWSGPTPLWGFCATGGGGNNGFFMSRDACNFAYCSGLKSSASAFSGAVVARGNSGAVNPSTAPSSRAAASASAPSRPLTSSELLIRSRVQAIMGRPVAPYVPAANSAPAVFNRPATSFSPDLARPAELPANVPAYAAPAARAGVMIPPPSSYYAQWAKPKITSCDSATTSNECREAAAAVQGNSMGSPRNTCEWSDGFGCRRVQLPL